MKKYTVLIVGGSGLIGQRLKYHFKKLNYNVKILSRSKSAEFYWNPEQEEFDVSILNDVDYIINLCGSRIDQKWTKKRKKEIYSSRVDTTSFLISHINSSKKKIKKYIGVSAIGYYNYNEILKNESSKQGNHFLSQICSDWEKQSLKIKNVSCCLLRIGVVLSKNGGMLKKLLFPFSMYLGASLANGKQKMSWIHIDDVCSMIIYCMKNTNNGIFNCVSPNPVSNKEFSEKLAKMLKKRIWLPNIPAYLLKIIFGEMATLMLGGLNVSSKKIEKSGFKFNFRKLDEALKDLID